jgi:hypothetical protein
MGRRCFSVEQSAGRVSIGRIRNIPDTKALIAAIESNRIFSRIDCKTLFHVVKYDS